jgi:hypothetical protein
MTVDSTLSATGKKHLREPSSPFSWLIVLLAVAVFLSLSLPRFRHDWVPIHDGAIYTLAAEGIYWPGGDAPDPYRGILPWVMKPLPKAAGNWYTFGRLLTLLVSLAGIFVVDALFREVRIGNRFRLLLLLIIFSNGYVLIYSTEIASEMYFCLFAWLTGLTLLHSWEKSFERYYFLLPLLLAYGFRKQGAFLIAAVCLWLLLTREFRRFLVTALFFSAVVAGDLLSVSRASGSLGTSTMTFFGLSVERTLSTLKVHAADTVPWLFNALLDKEGQRFFLPYWPLWARKIGFVVIAASFLPVLIAFFRSMRAKSRAPAVVCLAEAGMLSILILLGNIFLLSFFKFTYLRFSIFLLPFAWLAFYCARRILCSIATEHKSPALRILSNAYVAIPIVCLVLSLSSGASTAFLSPVYPSWMSVNEQTAPELRSMREAGEFISKRPETPKMLLVTESLYHFQLLFLTHRDVESIGESHSSDPEEFARNYSRLPEEVFFFAVKPSRFNSFLESRPDLFAPVFQSSSLPAVLLYRLNR